MPPGYNYDMGIEFDATYRSGAIFPNQPMALPENTSVRVVVVEKDTVNTSKKPRVVSTKGLIREQNHRPAAKVAKTHARGV